MNKDIFFRRTKVKAGLIYFLSSLCLSILHWCPFSRYVIVIFTYQLLKIFLFDNLQIEVLYFFSCWGGIISVMNPICQHQKK